MPIPLATVATLAAEERRPTEARLLEILRARPDCAFRGSELAALLFGCPPDVADMIGRLDHRFPGPARRVDGARGPCDGRPGARGHALRPHAVLRGLTHRTRDRLPAPSGVLQ